MSSPLSAKGVVEGSNKKGKNITQECAKVTIPSQCLCCKLVMCSTLER
ncbi:hypothetical protein ES332_D02G090600v1 [Gossypium tomentosum]|uniref:Uncharacterized protein n=1 Tax=Gossypium tomentosum TaxID=34277 RepID=A0A5D2LUX7_GOSTO|nr:hypothetical protein ES332_D02G090600v1 [Gossypium tomentosum]